MKRAAIYLRVSTAEQSSQLQVDATGELVTQRAWKIVQTYNDDGTSGATTRRPGLLRMREDARRGAIDVVVVYRADRLFRSLRELLATVHELGELGVGFVSVTEPFDTSTSSGRLMLTLVGAFAEFERDVLRERTKSGLDVARRRGKKLGRPPKKFPLAEALELKSSGVRVRAIARELGVPVTTVRRRLAG